MRTRILAAGLLLCCVTSCGDEYATIFTVYTDDPAPVAAEGHDRVELRSRAGFGAAIGTVTLNGRAVTLTSWTPDVILARIAAEDRSGELVVLTPDGRRIHGPNLHLGQGEDRAADGWNRHVDDYAARYGFGTKWTAFMKGEYPHFSAAFQRQELERTVSVKTLTLAYHDRACGPRAWPCSFSA